MKRLLDEDDPNDEVVRLLIRAGANHHPPRSSKLRMITALGLGSAVGLSASEVLAWLGTGSGKVALAVTVIGVAAGGTYLAASPDAHRAATPALSAVMPSPTPVGAPAASPASTTATSPASTTALASARDAAGSAPAAEFAAGASSLASIAAEERPKAAPRSGPARRKRPERARAAATRDRPAQPPAHAEPASAIATSERSAARLTEETTWVDRLRVAAESEDRQAFERWESEYAERFPEGQLRPEVDRLRALLR